jgi:hypothetical protein
VKERQVRPRSSTAADGVSVETPESALVNGCRRWPGKIGAFGYTLALCIGGNHAIAAAEASPSGDVSRHPKLAQGAPKEAKPGWRGALSLLEEYRLRLADAPLAGSLGLLGSAPAGDQRPDQDLRLLVDGDLASPDDRFRASFSGAMWIDLDGTPPVGSPDLFASQQDYRQPWWNIYTLSAEWRPNPIVELARFGRQTSQHGIPVTFDGPALQVRPVGPAFSLFAFGGRTVHFYETEPGLFENWIGSAGATLRATEHVRFEVDWRMLKETIPTASGDSARVTNQSVGLRATARFDELVGNLFARAIDGQVSHLGGAFSLEPTSLGFGLDGRVHAQLVTLGEVAQSENPMYAILGPSRPHVRANIEAWREVGIGQASRLAVYGGARLRHLVQGEESRFNRNTGAFYFRGQVNDWLTKGLYLSGTTELNYRPWSLLHSWFWTVGASAGFADQKLKAEVGTYYQQFKILYYRVADELQDVRTVYWMLGYRFVPWLDVRARYELEILDRNIHSAFLTLRQDF